MVNKINNINKVNSVTYDKTFKNMQQFYQKCKVGVEQWKVVS